MARAPLLPKAYRRRKRGTLSADRERLKRLYDEHTRGKIRGVFLGGRSSDPLLDATGDPLVKTDRELAARLYGFTNAKRPTAALRRIEAETFGNNLSSVADMALWFQNAKGWSALRSAGEAVVLCAERGVWIGVKAPVSFDKAVDAVRKEAKRRRTNRWDQSRAWTGRYLFVIPKPGLLVRLPGLLRQSLPPQGDHVRDDAYWRRIIADGDVTVRPVGEKGPTTEPGTMQR